MWAPGDPRGPAGWDRRRVGARLLAALAGLHELQGLRVRQQARVRGALAMQPPPAAPRGPRAPELRLEAALAALQEQLNWLRRQDVGLKTHLDQLDQQISELQLDVRRTSTEGPDSDSRPSSGFYELSDGGSCSLSASRTSVCSDRLSSSLGTLLPAAPKARTSAGNCRPWSADETTMCGAPLPVWGLQAPEDGAGPSLQHSSRPRPRPVSTGDLERALPAEEWLPTAGAGATPTSLRHGRGLPPHVLDPKYQRDLVSQGGREVYLYPSPLHAVALQSPLFALPKETLQRDSPPQPPNKVPPGPPGPGSALEPGRAQAYIDQLLALRGPGSTPRGSRGEQGPPAFKVSPSHGAETERHAEGLACPPRRANVERGAQRRGTGGDHLGQRGPVPLGSPPTPGSHPEERWRPSSSCVLEGTTPGSPRLGNGPRAQQAAPSGGESQARLPTRTGPGPCLHPHSVPSRAAPPGPHAGQNTGHPTSKAVRVGRGPSDKAPWSGRQPPSWGALRASQLPPTWGAGLRRRNPQAREGPGRSCSETSLCRVSFLVPLLMARREGRGASAQALFPLEEAPLGAAGGEARRRPRRWQSSVEISARARLPGAQGPGLGPPRPAPWRGGGLRPVSARARPRLPRRDPQARSESGGSERSAQRASLFNATVAATSEDQASDHTANRFGDGESSGSDAERHGRGAGSRPAWPGVSLQPPPWAPAGSGPPLPPVPRLCRVKASRALKKKIRRFQPAALKVMTLV